MPFTTKNKSAKKNITLEEEKSAKLSLELSLDCGTNQCEFDPNLIQTRKKLAIRTNKFHAMSKNRPNSCK